MPGDGGRAGVEPIGQPPSSAPGPAGCPLGRAPEALGTQPVHWSLSLSTSDRGLAEYSASQCLAPHTLRVRRTSGFEATLDSADIGRLGVTSSRYRSFGSIHTSEPLDFYAVTLALTGHLVVELDGSRSEVPAGQVVVHNPGEMPRITGPATSDTISIRIPTAVVAHHLRSYLDTPASVDSVTFSTGGQPRRDEALVHAVRTVWAAARYGDRHSPPGTERLEKAVTSSLLLGRRHNWTDQLYRAGPDASEAAVWDAVATMRATFTGHVSVADLAADAGVSVRSLQLAFRRILGASPSGVLRALRLDLAEQLICDAPPDDLPSVSSVAAAVGYVNDGRFAADFATRFGVYPSHAVRARRHRG